jgi:hypothetical protein
MISHLENLSDFEFVDNPFTAEDPLNFPTTLTLARFKWEDCTPAKALEFALQRAPARNSGGARPRHAFLVIGVRHWQSRYGAHWMEAMEMAQNVGVTPILDDFAAVAPPPQRELHISGAEVDS